MSSEYWVVNIHTAALSGCVYPIKIGRGGNVRRLPKISFEGFFLKGCCQYSVDALEFVQGFGFKNKGRGSSEIKPIW